MTTETQNEVTCQSAIVLQKFTHKSVEFNCDFEPVKDSQVYQYTGRHKQEYLVLKTDF